MPQLPSDKQGLERLAKQLQELAKKRDGSKQDRQEAERLRELAKNWWDQASPEQRQQARELAQRMAQQRGEQDPGAKPPVGGGGDPGQQTERSGQPGGPAGDGPAGQARGEASAQLAEARDRLDARPRPGEVGKSAGDRVVGEWLGTGKKGAGSGPADADEARRVLRDAAKSAQDAVEDRTLPRRYDRLLRRFFQRVPGEMGLTDDAPGAGPGGVSGGGGGGGGSGGGGPKPGS